MELNTLANLAEIVGVIIVIGGFAFAIVQLLHFRRQRQERSAIELARSFETPEFAHALRMILSLPAGIRADELRARGDEYEDAAMLVSLTLESVGIMVHRRIVSFDLVWELMGGVVLGAWDRIRDWAFAIRHERGDDKFDEWIHWLAAQMSKYRARTGSQPAYREHDQWRP
jgi:hypothetical protein